MVGGTVMGDSGCSAAGVDAECWCDEPGFDAVNDDDDDEKAVNRSWSWMVLRTWR